MKKNYWAKAPLPHEQIVLFQTKLDEVISDDHPRILALLWLYGLRRGFRSGRKKKYMTQTNLDFMWLAEGHRPDHTTFCNFRTDFKVLPFALLPTGGTSGIRREEE